MHLNFFRLQQLKQSSKKETKNESQTKSKASEQEYSKLIHGHCAPCRGRQHWRLLRLGQVAQDPYRHPHRHRGLDRVGKLCTLSTCKLCIPKSSSVWREALASSYSPWCWCSVGESFGMRKNPNGGSLRLILWQPSPIVPIQESIGAYWKPDWRRITTSWLQNVVNWN